MKYIITENEEPWHHIAQQYQPRGRRRLRHWTVTGAAAIATIALSVSLVSSFQVSVPPLRSSAPFPQQPRPFVMQQQQQQRYDRSLGDRRHSLKAAATVDADILLLDRIRQKPVELFFLSEEEADEQLLLSEQPNSSRLVEKANENDDADTDNTRSDRDKTEPPIQFKGLSTTASKKNKKKTTKAATVKATTTLNNNSSKTPTQQSSRASKSSTMPGFAGDSDKQRAYRDGIRLVEQRTGKKFKDSDKARRKRKKVNGDLMYKNSASVPDSLVQFAEEIHQEDRITRAQEVELGEKTQEAIRLQNLYDNLETKLQREPTDEEWCAEAGKLNMEAIRQTIEEGLDAKNKLVTSNLRMVQSVVNTYIRNGLSAQYNAGDLMQEGIMALIRAAEKFEPDRGWRFSTYAMYWVRASVKRSQIFQSRIVTVPQRLYENHKRLLRTEKQLQESLGRKPTRKEIGEAVGMSELQVTRCLTAMEQKCFSLDQEISNTLKPMNGDAEKDTLIELIESRTDDGEHNKQELVFLREDLIETLKRHLTPEEVELLLLRYGLKDGPTSKKIGRQPTIAELSEMVGLKPDKVRRIINRSLKQLQAIGLDEWLAFQRDI